MPKKPSPDGLIKVGNAVPQADCLIMVGDSKEDYECAMSAGWKFLKFTGGYGTFNEELGQSAIIEINSIRDVLKFV